MSLTLSRAQVRRFHSLGPEEQQEKIEGMAPNELLTLDAMFEMWADDGQQMPGGEGWRVWLMMAGRGFGKTRAGAEWVHNLAVKRGVRIAIAGATIDEARSVMVEGASGILSVARSRKAKVKWEPSLRRLTWPSGSIAELFSGDNADGLRGPEHHFAWCVAATRCRGGGSRRKRGGRHPARKPRRRPMLHRWTRAHRTLDGTGQSNCRICGRGLALCRGNRGNARAR